MTDNELKVALESYTRPGAARVGQVRESLLDCVAGKNGATARRKSLRLRYMAAAAAVLVCVVFLRTAPGAAAAEYVKEQVNSLIQLLFPPKEETVIIEGFEDTANYVGQGQEPEAEKPGFALYVDSQRYMLVEENGISYVRPVPIETDNEEFYASLPPCEMEIEHLEGVSVQDAAEAEWMRMERIWNSISEIESRKKPAGLFFYVSGGSEWDSPQEDVYFVDDGQGGVFRISIRYFLEATEGHGVRLREMLSSFEVLESK